MNAQRIWAHLLMLFLIGLAGTFAYRVSYPNISALLGIYMIMSVGLYQVSGRLAQAGQWNRFGRVGKMYTQIFGLGSFYLASDAFVLEQAYYAYPAPLIGFLAFGIAVIGLAVVTMLRRSTASEIYVTHPGFVSIGIALFVGAVTTQLLAMTALSDWGLQVVLYRIIFIASTVWIAQMGVYERSPATVITAGLFAVLGIMTAYLDILWSIKETLGFLIGAIALALALLVVFWIWSSRRIADIRGY